MFRPLSTRGTASRASTPEGSGSAGPAHEVDPTPDSRAVSTSAHGGDDDSDDTESRSDPLAQLELEAFGADAVDDALPPPPRDPNAPTTRDAAAAAAAAGAGPASLTSAPLSSGGGAGSATFAGQGTGTKRTLAASGPIARAKRPKNVKFSPAKTGKALARRAAAAAVSDGGSGAYQLPNHDYCDACGGKGHFLCCEGGCLRSFHFSCLEPPLELDEVPEDSWYCKTCRANINPPVENAHRFFGDLITRVETENPKQFSLPSDIKSFFKNVASGVNGEFIDSVEHRPPSKITGRAIGQEDRDGFRLKDKNGRPIICYNCDGAANPAQRRRIISCDFCDQHWHLDCLDPPMTGMPPPTRKWMCPLHSDIVIPRKRQPKQTQLVTIDQPYRPNNGDIIVIPRREETLQQDVDEMTVNRVRYQVPEQHIILDFWGRLTGQKNLPATSRKSKGKSPRKRSTSGYDSGDSSPLSDLTSSDDESGSDGERSSSRPAGPANPPVPSALDNLALLAEVRYIDYLAQQQQQQPQHQNLNGTPGKSGSATGPLAGAKPPAVHDLPPALPNSTQRRLPPRGLASPSSAAVGVPSAPGGSVVKRPSFGGRAAATPYASPVPGASSRSRGGSPSVSPAPGKLADVTVESKEDLKALGHVRKLIAAQSKQKEGDAKKAALLEYLEGALIVPRLQSIGHGPAPWSRPWDDKPGTPGAGAAATHPVGAAAAAGRKPVAAAAAPAAAPSQASPSAESPSTSPALGTGTAGRPAAPGSPLTAPSPAPADGRNGPHSVSPGPSGGVAASPDQKTPLDRAAVTSGPNPAGVDARATAPIPAALEGDPALSTSVPSASAGTPGDRDAPASGLPRRSVSPFSFSSSRRAAVDGGPVSASAPSDVVATATTNTIDPAPVPPTVPSAADESVAAVGTAPADVKKEEAGDAMDVDAPAPVVQNGDAAEA